VKGNHVAGQKLPPEGATSTCPECGTEMVITRITPILFGGKFEDLALACKTCGFTKQLRIERI
jgi:transcription elongation factor Elf1